MLRPDQIRAALEEILPLVQQPVRYLGLERNLVRKPWDSVPLHVALAFPDAYEVGMSHQGSQILYHLINRRPDAVAARNETIEGAMSVRRLDDGLVATLGGRRS